jgi:hypothetical protein
MTSTLDNGGPRSAVPAIASRDGWLVGRIYRIHMPRANSGDGPSLATSSRTCRLTALQTLFKEANRDFGAAWRRWLEKTGKDEETHRPLYGWPVDIGNEPELEPGAFASRQQCRTAGAECTVGSAFNFTRPGTLLSAQALRAGPGNPNRAISGVSA